MAHLQLGTRKHENDDISTCCPGVAKFLTGLSWLDWIMKYTTQNGAKANIHSQDESIWLY